MSLYREPPESVTVKGKEYPIETDFRRWIEFQGMLVAKEDDVKKAERLCGFMESLGLPLSQESLEAMMEFYSAASQEKPGAGRH
ncbi:MAG: hypothetical protein EGP82_07345 [Odoribacter splanchnicus]|nr:hypothetical protein [Odoribacter splanchnicus]